MTTTRAMTTMLTPVTMVTSKPRRLHLALVACCALAFGCATVSHPTLRVDPQLAVGRLAERTQFESKRAPVVRDEGGRSRGKTTPALFWTGIVLGTLGVATGIGTGVAGQVAGVRLQDAYDDGLTLEREQRLTDAGETLNTITITGYVVGIVGYALAVTTWGIDYTRCGPLAPKRRGCDRIQRHP